MLKWLFDKILAIGFLVIASPLLLLISLLIKLDSKGSIFFIQSRVGRFGKEFKIIKFRTMYQNNKSNNLLTQGEADIRITRIGKVIRKIHFDEVIQLINVLKGEMSLVGPRPEVEKYTNYYPQLWEKVLKVKPGITGLTVLNYSDYEYRLLSKAKNREQVYIKKLLPLKLKSDILYIKKQSFIIDLLIIAYTLLKIVGVNKTLKLNN